MTEPREPRRGLGFGRKQKIVIRRGPSCCGCGCVIPTAVVPGVALLLSSTLGPMLAIAVAVPAGLAAVHALAALGRTVDHR